MMAPSPSLVGAVAALDPKAMRATLAELDRVDARDSLVRYAPYPKQRSFHEMGATKRIRALFGGNQCLAPESPIETDRGQRAIGEMMGEGPLTVRSWADGAPCFAQSGPVFFKGVEPAFRLDLDNGQAIECSRRHRVLTVDGWREVGDILPMPDWQSPPNPEPVLAHVALVGGRTIDMVTAIGPRPILDITVPGTDCYLAEGVVHHNSGKSVCGAAEMAFHLTGRYPKRGQVFYPAFCHDGSPHPLALQDAWPNGWTGHRFKRPIKAWASGLTSIATRDNAQTKLVGPPEHEHLWGTGAIPADAIVGTPSRARGTANALDSVSVRHSSGGVSTVWFKSYEQGRRNWQGPTLDCMSFDEEPPSDIWAEGTTRCNAVNDARIWATFTPLEGLSEVVTLLMAGRPLKALFDVD